jgi:hypothetical protein
MQKTFQLSAFTALDASLIVDTNFRSGKSAIIYDLQLSQQLNSVKSSCSVSHIRCFSVCLYQIPDDDDLDGPQNVSFIQMPDMADSLRRFH